MQQHQHRHFHTFYQPCFTVTEHNKKTRTKTNNMKSTLLAIAICVALKGFTQPYVDPLHVRYTYGFKSNSGSGTPFSHFYFGPDLPLKLKNNGLFVISPVYEKWNIDSSSQKAWLPQVTGIALALSAIIPLDKNHWSLTISAIPRINGEELNTDDNFQIGGVMLASYKKKETLKFKFGIYANREFFGLFIIPLAGIDWRIDERNNLFGVLPGKLSFEHKLSTRFYTGATFRAITNSYRLNNSNYLRIDDNQISSFIDCYVTKHIVITSEAGYGIMRELKSGNGYNKHYLTQFKWDDGLFIKLSASYRIRL